jgi:hypothetical protein
MIDEAVLTPAPGHHPMITLTALAFIVTITLSATLWARRRLNTASLGTMSDQWLSEQRAADSASPNG